MGHYDSAYEADEEKDREFRRKQRERKAAKAVEFIKDKFGWDDQEAKEYIGVLLIDDKIRDMLK